MLDLIERLDEAVKSEDWPEIAEIRHAIEGTARGSGAAAIAELIGDLKTLGAAEPAERRARIATLRACFAATREAMRDFLSKRATALPRVESRAEPVIPSP
jgi:HPt (histidine-containing phosphotransfer) domain-containing protein